MSKPEERFIRAAKIARNLDVCLRTARNQVKRGVYGPPHFMHGEWVAPWSGYVAFIESAKVPPPAVKASQLRHLRRGRPAPAELAA